ncbi:MAG: lactate utilization protein [Deltaproteobacteria bacterium]|nr:MAG: lactate utilization protein [Deltaproteobacteria bacterium]
MTKKDEEKVNRTISSLKDHGFEAIYVKNKDKARAEILKHIPPTAKVGIGGSATIREIGIIPRLKEQGNVIYDHWNEELSPEQVLETRKAQMTSDVFLSSTNALTESGELVSREGIGNRTNSMCFGPGKVIIAAGTNKIVPDVHAALKRIKEVAAPLRNKSLNTANPCVETGVCQDCNLPTRICRITLIMERKPVLTDILVIVIGENLGY